ncbi:MAG: MazG family protein [Clostridia bacterium]|nr:MazG family protein [Clostridia bacterium]
MNNDKERLLKEEKHSLYSLELLTKVLRSPGGCPWDREQDHHSIRNDMIEECYEVVEAIDTDNVTLLREELGDVLFQVYFHAQIEAEKGHFTIDDVVQDICDKMIYRHPHVFSDVQADTSEKVLENWETLKQAEKQRKDTKSSMAAVPPMLPALMRASKVAGKALKDDYSFGTDAEIRQQMTDCLLAIGTEREEENLAKLSFLSAILSKKHGGDLEAALQKETDEFINQYNSTKIMEEKNEQD